MPAALKAVRGAELALKRPLGVLADLQGPKLRLGRFADVEIDVKPGHKMRFDLDETPGDATRVQMPHPEIFKALRTGMLLLLDDGRVRLRVGERTDKWADVTVESGSKLSDRKGVAVPEAVVPVSALTGVNRDKARGTERSIKVVAESGIEPGRVVIDHLNEVTVAPVKESGCWAGFSIYPDTKMSPPRMVEFGEVYDT